MIERKFQVGGHEYAAGRLDAFQQLHVASQWREMVLGLAFAKKGRTAAVTDEQFRQTKLVIMTGGLGQASFQSREDIARLCLSVVTRSQKDASGVGWAKILAPDGSLMFQDIQLPQMVDVLYEVLEHNGIVDFFSGGLSDFARPTT